MFSIDTYNKAPRVIVYAVIISAVLIWSAFVFAGTISGPLLASGDCECEGKVSELTLKYLGGSAATVRVVGKRSGTTELFNGTVLPGGTFTLVGPNDGSGGFAGTLGTEIDIFVNGIYHTTFHTSCSQLIGPGLQQGDFIVVSGESKEGGTLPDVNTGQCTPPPPSVPACTLLITPSIIEEGESAILSWTSTNATSATLDNSIGSVVPVEGGFLSVSPSQSTTYTGIFTGDGGTVTCSASIEVEDTPTPPPAPTCTLTATPSEIEKGDSATLTWTSTNTTSGSIDQGVGSVTPVGGGSVDVSPLGSITYMATFIGDGGTAVCDASVTVDDIPPPPPPPPSVPACTLSVTPGSISEGESATLSWISTNATSGTIDNGIGSVTPVSGGNTSVTPSTGTTYTGTFTGDGGTATCSASIEVEGTPPPPPPPPPPVCTVNCGGGGPHPPTCTLSANPTTIKAGGSSRIEWSSGNTATGSIDQGVGAISPVNGGSVMVSPNTTTLYTATFIRDNQSIMCTATITIEGTPPVCTANCGGGGGPNPPGVVLFAKKIPNEQPLAFVYLSQIPYTGFFPGSTGEALLWTLMIILSGVIAYIISEKNIARRALAVLSGTFGMSFPFTPTPFLGLFGKQNTRSVSRGKVWGFIYNRETHTLHRAPAALERSPAQTGAEEYAWEESGAVSSDPQKGLETMIENRAHELGVLISNGAAQTIIEHAAIAREDSLILLEKLYKKALLLYPQEDGWIHLDSLRLGALLAQSEQSVKSETHRKQILPDVSATHSQTGEENLPAASVHSRSVDENNAAQASETDAMPIFVGWLCDGRDDKVFTFLRMIKLRGQSSNTFLNRVVCALDEVYRSRLEGNRITDDFILEKTKQLSNKELEALIDCLSAGVDYSYEGMHTGVKMACVRALDVSKKK